jgi:OPA family glycerol-3-phosphate transporter-like MFS transporter
VTAGRTDLPALVALFVGYAAAYLVRADLAVAAPLLLADANAASFGPRVDVVASLAMLVYGAAKLGAGLLADRGRARLLFVAALLGAGAMALLLARAESFASFAASRLVGMAVLALGWPALVRITAGTAPPGRLGFVLGMLSLSYLFGDAAARWQLGRVAAGGDWRAVFASSGAWLLGVGLVVAVLLRPWRRTSAAISSTSSTATPAVHARLPWRPLLWLCGLNAAVTLVREALNLWGPTLLAELGDVSPGSAAQYSAVLPCVGAVATLLAGHGSDRWPSRLQQLTVGGAVWLGLALALLAVLDLRGQPAMLTALLSIANFGLMVPMSLVSGVLVVRAAGVGRAGAAMGLVDGAGSLGASGAGVGVHALALRAGYPAAFAALAVLAFVAAGCALMAARAVRPSN